MYGSPGVASLMGAGNNGGNITNSGSSNRGMSTFLSPCRPRVLKVLLLVVGLLMMAQFSMNLLFYRNYDSLFYVNSTAGTSDGVAISPLQSRLRWVSSWMQPIPVSPPRNAQNQANRNTSQPQRTTREGGQLKTSPPSQVNKSANQSDVLSAKSANDSDKNTGDSVKNSYVKMTPKPLHELSKKQGGVDVIVMDTDKSDSLSTEKPLCPPVPPKLVGRVKVRRTAPALEDQERSHTELEPGGHYRPSECRARHKVAIIIPYRDRVAHLSIFLHHLHPILQRQQVDYAIFVVEQAGSGKFNRAMLMNVGALEALKQYRFSCFIFHDVDLLPEDDRNLYTCPEQPRHMSIAIDVMKYKLPYNDIFGGVSAMTVDQFRAVNGFSNKFWGWGGEDDDMSNRIKYHGFFISRYPANIGRYTMLSHKKDEPNPKRYQYLHDGKKRFKSDGIVSAKYRVLDIQLRRLYTWVYVDLQPS